MEDYLGVGRSVIDLEKMWRDSDPTGTGEPLAQYMNKVRHGTIEIAQSAS